MARLVLSRKKRSRPAPIPVPVVGIGASAGGLEAFTMLLKALSPNTGMAFVLITHLMHEKKSVLGELLSKATSMPVSQLNSDTRVEANHVYVIPPDNELTIEDGYLRMHALASGERPPMVIDRFFRSLAQDRTSKSVGVILSGTGSDGTFGLGDIKGEGGITFVQDPASAAYGEMPANARAAADYVLSPKQIADELKRIAGHPYVSHEPIPAEAVPPHNGELREIFRLLQTKGGVDFGRYKPASIRRRIARRMVLKKIESHRDYLKYLRANKDELDALYQDVLITVTEFFRDPEAFAVLKNNIIPHILNKLPNEMPARVWVPACASGEEAYSIAICFLEAAKDRAGPPAQIFATDVSEQCIARARRAIYPESITANVSPERLQRFFMKVHNGYQVSKFTRDLCIFAKQNVLGDAPFSQMDLVSCRNLLIYLDNAAQQEVLQRFHYALKPSGFLFLGASESVGAAPQLFEQSLKAQRVYSKLPAPGRIDFLLTATPPAQGAVPKHPADDSAQPIEDRIDAGREADFVLLRRFAPAGLLLDSAKDILEFRGSTGPFIQPAPGEASLNIFKMVRQDLAIPLRIALNEAKTSPKPVRREDLEIHVDHETKKITLEVIRLKPDSKGHLYYLVIFEEPPPAPERKNDKPMTRMRKSPASRRISELEKDLKSADVHLRSIVEERDNTNQELQSANEEIQASNEELQSMNEEMQTAKEELQATNEELHSVNDELQRRNIEVGDAYSDLNNLVRSLDVINVVIDSQLRIQRFTPAAQKTLNLIPTDIGRPIADITPNITISDLPEVVQDVIKTLSTVEREVQDNEGHWYLLRVRPYKRESMQVDGVVLSLQDIDNLKRAESALKDSDRQWQTFIDEAPDFIINPDGRILLINRTVAGSLRGAAIGATIYEAVEPADRPALQHAVEEVRKTGVASTVKFAGADALAHTSLQALICPIKSDGNVIGMTILTKELSQARNGQPDQALTKAS